MDLWYNIKYTTIFPKKKGGNFTLKILIADADAETSSRFKTFLKIAKGDDKFAGVSKGLKELIKEIGVTGANVIVGDIRFFGVAGWQTMREAKEFYPEICFIVYGLMSEVDYIQKVMEYGVVDYMFKPVRPTDFERALNRARTEINRYETEKSRRAEISRLCLEQADFFKDRFLISLLRGQAGGDFDIQSAFRHYKLNLVPQYAAFIVRIDHYRQIMLTLDETGKHLLIFEAKLAVEEALKAQRAITLITRFNSIAVIIGAADDDVLSLCEEVKSEVGKAINLSVTIGVGRRYENPSDIATSYREAEAALRHRHYVGYNTVIPLQYVEPNNDISYRYPLSKEEELVYSAAAGEITLCEKLVGQLFDSLKSCSPLPEKLASKTVLDIAVSINRLTDELRLPYDVDAGSFFPAAEILAIKTPEDAKSFLTRCLKNYCAKINTARRAANPEILIKAKQYVGDRYFKNVTLAETAQTLNVTPEFLGNIFLEQERESFHEYLVRVRVDSAKRLLAETELSEDAIAAEVGYTDTRRFRSIFKLREGVYPYEYARKPR